MKLKSKAVLFTIKRSTSKAQKLDYKLIAISALVMASIVFYINSGHGYLQASSAALKQAVYTFFTGSLIFKVLEVSLSWFNHKILSIIAGVLFTSILTTMLVFIVHSMRGTPEPIDSTIPTLVLAPFGLFVVAMKKKYIDHSSKEYD